MSNRQLRSIKRVLKRIEIAVDAMAAVVTAAIGIHIDPGVPVPRPQGERIMAKPTVKLVKKSVAKKLSTAAGPFGADNFVFIDNEDSTCTVHGVDAAGSPVDISAIATLAVTSSDPATISVDPPTGMTFKMHGLKASVPGTPVVIGATATWNDGSRGPFSFNLPCDVTGDVATGIVIVPGVPVVRP